MLEVGAQIIALNTQTKDDYAWLLRSYFTAGREIMEALNIGYIDKPINLRTKQSADSIKRVYTIRIISQDNVVSMKFFGTEADMVVNAKQTNRFEVKNPN